MSDLLLTLILTYFCLQVKILVQRIIPVRCVLLIRLFAVDIFNVLMDIWNNEHVQQIFSSIVSRKHVNLMIKPNVMVTNPICHFLRSLHHRRCHQQQHQLRHVNLFPLRRSINLCSSSTLDFYENNNHIQAEVIKKQRNNQFTCLGLYCSYHSFSFLIIGF